MIMATHYAIYRNPSDHPGRYVVRAWHVMKDEPRPIPSRECTVADSLAAARAAVPDGLIRIEPLPGDDACLEETWL